MNQLKTYIELPSIPFYSCKILRQLVTHKEQQKCQVVRRISQPRLFHCGHFRFHPHSNPVLPQ